jgi:hypothetical protein
MYGHYAFASTLFSFVCHDTVSYYDTTLTSLFINYCATLDFCQHSMHDTSYDTLIVTSLSLSNLNTTSLPDTQIMLVQCMVHAAESSS